MPSYSKESYFLSYANAKHFLLLKKKSCGKADIKRLILKCRNSSSAYSTVLCELQDLSKDRLHKAVNVCPVRFSKDVWNRCTHTQKGRGFTDSAWWSEMIRNLKLVNTTCSIGSKRHVVRLKESKRLHLPLFKCEGYCTPSTCNVQFQLHVNEDFQGKVSFQCKMPVKLITICRLRLFVARTQLNALKHAFIYLAESRTKCLIHFIVKLRKMAILDPSMFDTVVRNPFCRHSFSHECSFSFNLVCMLVQIPNPRNVFISALKMVTLKIRPFKIFNSLSFVIH